ncbi:uncharacterized protein LOC122502985 [Leptopilina heterotoma]|uniref:uncharacterized protein LOC122502985 n=1 Tax=Leptopilina heterotoma TaxID=63436 RepID=UPI001CA7E103|nr:uncharacterized protein LOC122502985 [Leptopilina heterotoma]
MAQLKTTLLFSIIYICLLMTFYCYAEDSCINAGLRCRNNPKRCCDDLECLPAFINEVVCRRRESPRCLREGMQCIRFDRNMRCCGDLICEGAGLRETCRRRWN